MGFFRKFMKGKTDGVSKEKTDGVSPEQAEAGHRGKVCERCGCDLSLISKKLIVEIDGKRYCDVCAEYLSQAASAPKVECAACHGSFPASEMTSVYGKKLCLDCKKLYFAGKLPNLAIAPESVSDGAKQPAGGSPKPAADGTLSTADAADETEAMLDDVSYIREMKHLRGMWQRYDFLLAARGYGWDTMVDWAAYMEEADLDHISTITTAEMANLPETELIDEYRKSQGGIKAFERLSAEKGQLAIGGFSRVLKAPVKLVWFNQTRVLRVLTTVDDEGLLMKYTETVIRRTFGTADAMKLAKPVPKS